MGSAKRIVHKHVAQRGHFAGQRFVVFLLARVDAAVLQQHHLAGLHGHAIDPVGGQSHLTAEQLCKASRHRSQRVFRLERALNGPTQVAGDHDRRARAECHLNARHRCANTCVFGDLARIAQRHVEVSADEDALAAHGTGGTKVGEASELHGGVSRKTADFRRQGFYGIESKRSPTARAAPRANSAAGIRLPPARCTSVSRKPLSAHWTAIPASFIREICPMPA